MGNLKLSPRNWTRIKSTTLRAKPFPGTPTKFQPIQPLIFPVDTPLCVVLLSNPQASYRWYSAGFVGSYLYSGAFVSRQIIKIKNWHLGLDRPELIDFRHYNTSNRRYALEINSRPWHRQMKVEVWKYKNEINDSVDEYIQSIKEQLNTIEQQVQNLTDYSL